MNKDYELSNVSFTNKDFFDVYPELLQLAKKLSAKWDPTVSNESDPGVVLIKELALITDKINYIADKYALENNPRSVTQIENARQLYNLLGYYPRWYESAKVNLSLYWDGEKEEGNYVTIPKYTGVQDPDGEFVYTILNDITLPLNGNFASGDVEAIEGTYHRLVVNNSDIITLSMISDDQRIYISNYNVAENGIFITDTTGRPWNKVENINLIKSGATCYSFNTDIATGRCYIQFSKDIASLIGDGLIIHYIVSKGKYGNIPINALTKLVNSSMVLTDAEGNERTFDMGNLKITNSGSTYLGKDPETIDEMYDSWKTIAGTFDTLVTLRDYNNAARRYPDYASNAFVCDRTNDIQLSYKVMSGTPSMPTEKTKIEKTEVDNPEEAEEKLKPYDLKLYGLRSFPYENIDRYYYYDSTFMLFPEVGPYATPTDIGTNVWLNNIMANAPLDSAYKKLVDAISTHECISHMFTSLEPDKIALLKNKYNIDIQILATSELTDLQIKDVKANICRAIYNNFNSNKVEFGEKIDYDELLECIRNSDSRIKTAILNRLTYDTYAVFYRDVGYIQWIETPVSDDAYKNFNWEENYTESWIREVARIKAAEFRKEIVAKNILAGITPFIVSDGTPYPLELSNYVELNNIEATHISTNVIIPLEYTDSKTSASVTLGPNEVISFSKPNLVDVRSYGAYIYYEYKGPGFVAQQDHVLGSNESLCFFYKEAEGDAKYRFDLYGPGTIVKSSIPVANNELDIIATVFGSKLPTQPGECLTSYRALSSIRQYTGLSVKDTIDIKKVNKFVLGNPEDYIYFITNKIVEDMYVLEFTNNRRILGENEYFIYTNSTKTSLEILGSGTEIRWIDSGTAPDLTCKYTEVASISRFGSSALVNKWLTLKSQIEIIEKSFTNALEGDKVTFQYPDSASLILDSTGIRTDDELLQLLYEMNDYKGTPVSPVNKVGSVANQKLFLERMNAESFEESFYNHYLTLLGMDLRGDDTDPNEPDLEGYNKSHIYVWKSEDAYDGKDHYIYDYDTFYWLLSNGQGEVDNEKLKAYQKFLGITDDTLERAETGLLVTIGDMLESSPASGVSPEPGTSEFDWLPTEDEIKAFLSWYYDYMSTQGQFRYLQQFITYPDSVKPEQIPGSHIYGRGVSEGYSYTKGGQYLPLSEFVKISINDEQVDTTSSFEIATECHAYLNIDTSSDTPQVIRAKSGIVDQVFFYKDNVTTPIASINSDIESAQTYNLYSSDALFVEGSYEPVSVVLLDDHLEEYNPKFYAVRNIPSAKSSDDAGGVTLYTKTGNYAYINFGTSAAQDNVAIFSINAAKGNVIKLPPGKYILNLAHSNTSLEKLELKLGPSIPEGTPLKEMSTGKTDLSDPGSYYLVFERKADASGNPTTATLSYSYSLKNKTPKTKAQMQALTNYKYGEIYQLSENVSNEYITAKKNDFLIAKKDFTTESKFSWADFGVTPTPISSLVISGLMKYTFNADDEFKKNSTDYLSDDIEFEEILALVKELDYDNEFNYLYKVPEQNMIRNPLNSESFFNVNHVYNKFTIPEAKKPEILV